MVFHGRLHNCWKNDTNTYVLFLIHDFNNDKNTLVVHWAPTNLAKTVYAQLICCSRFSIMDETNLDDSSAHAFSIFPISRFGL